MTVPEQIFALLQPILWFGSLGWFVVRTGLHGLPRTERVRRAGGSALGPFLLEYGYWLVSKMVDVFVNLGFSANALTWLTLPFSLGAAIAFARGDYPIGANLFILGAVLDSVDGQVARKRGTSSSSGELWDAIADRYTESFVFAGLAYYYRDRPAVLVLDLLAWSGALMVSYARAKADASGVDCGSGPMQRHERAAYLAFATVGAACDPFIPALRSSHPLHVTIVAALALVALLTHYTAVRRAWRGYEALRKREEPSPVEDTGHPLPEPEKIEAT